MNVALADVNDTLQIYLGSLFVNDFNRFGRTYQVTAEADANFRVHAEDIQKLKTRNAAGDMVPLGTLVEVHETTGPDKVIRYNMYPAADINGVAVPGVSSGQAIALAQQLAAKELPPDRKSTRLNSSHLVISYAVFCLKKKKNLNKMRR